MTTRANEQVSCRTAPAIDHTEPSSIAAKPASSPGVLRHLRRFSYSVTSLEAMTVFARRSEHGLSDGVWYALEALPCMVESNDASALCVRFGLSQEDLDALLSECGCLTGSDKAATFKAGIKRLTGETVQVFRERHFLLEYHARVKYARAHSTSHACKPDLRYRTNACMDLPRRCVAFGVEPAESCVEQRAHSAHADGGGNYRARRH